LTYRKDDVNEWQNWRLMPREGAHYSGSPIENSIKKLLKDGHALNKDGNMRVNSVHQRLRIAETTNRT